MKRLIKFNPDEGSAGFTRKPENCYASGDRSGLMTACVADTKKTLVENLRTLLQRSTQAEADEVATLLRNVDSTAINEPDPATGDTVLHVAARTADLAVVQLLLAAGVDPLRHNAKGRTPGGQLNIQDDVRTQLDAAAAARQANKDAARAAVWGGAVQRTQTESAFRVQTL